MFHDVPAPVLGAMRDLERRDATDRADGTPRSERLRQVPPETGRFLALWAASAPAGAWIEIGTSAGYSALWLALAAREVGATVTTYEVDPSKAALARDTFRIAGVTDVVRLVEADFLDDAGGPAGGPGGPGGSGDSGDSGGPGASGGPGGPGGSGDPGDVAFSFLDAEKELYGACYDAVVPRLVRGGILVADNAINHQATLQPMIDRALADARFDALVVPIGKGELVCRRR